MNNVTIVWSVIASCAYRIPAGLEEMRNPDSKATARGAQSDQGRTSIMSPAGSSSEVNSNRCGKEIP
jgi:hypothetical protein